jgi:hypothetical protein
MQASFDADPVHLWQKSRDVSEGTMTTQYEHGAALARRVLDQARDAGTFDEQVACDQAVMEEQIERYTALLAQATSERSSARISGIFEYATGYLSQIVGEK